MELNIKELKNINTMNPYDKFNHKEHEQNSINYWDEQTTKDNKERKKVSFNDILTNMNLVVNKEGVLQFMVPNKQDNYEQDNSQYTYNPNNFSQSSPNQDPLDHSVKHSYIYNKYFKDYADPNAQQPAIRVPKTIQEYRQMILEDRIKAIQHKKRVEQIKSTKLMFTSAPGSVSNPRNMKASQNSLRTMNFR
jgi:hypothetical protein